jgi:hypothetical protein
MVRDTSNLTRFVESASIDHRLIREASKQEFTESLIRAKSRLTESLEDTGKGWWVPISHYGNYKNGNGRIYNTRLWENVINNQREIWCGSPMLTDHPEGDSDGNPRDICGVWLDAKFGEPGPDGVGIVYGLLVPSGHNGEDLRDHLQNGLRIGTSSSGFGKLLPDKVTVDPDTYQIERLADWVLNPSQGTFFSYDESNGDIKDRTLTESGSNLIYNIRDTAERYMRCNPYVTRRDVVEYLMDTYNDVSEDTIERILEPYEFMDESNKNNTSNEYLFKEKVVKDSKFTKLEEKKFRRDMESFLESASNIKDPQERLEEFKDIRGWLEEGACPDLKEKVEAKIAEEEAYIKVALKEKAEMKDQLGVESTKDLKEKLTKIVQDQKILEKESKDWKAVSEKLQEKLMESEKELKKRASVEFTEFQKNKIDALNEKIEDHDKKAADTLKEMINAYKALQEKCKGLEDEVSSLKEKNECLDKECGECNMKLELANNENKELQDHYAEVSKQLGESQEKIKKYKVLFENQRAKFEESLKKIDELRKINESKNEKISALAKEAKVAQTELKKINLQEAKARRAQRTDTEVYYDDLYEQYGNQVVPYKDRITEAISLAEAKQVFFKEILPSLNESVAIEESRIPETLYTTPEERARAINGKAFYRQSVMDRMPKGWK